MPNAVVITGYGPPEVLKWTGVPLWEPGKGQIRINVKAAGISPTDLALRAGFIKAIPLPPNTVLGFEAAGTVDAVGPGVTGTSASRHPPRSRTSSERSTTSTTIVCAQPPCRANPSGRVTRKPGRFKCSADRNKRTDGGTSRCGRSLVVMRPSLPDGSAAAALDDLLGDRRRLVAVDGEAQAGGVGHAQRRDPDDLALHRLTSPPPLLPGLMPPLVWIRPLSVGPCVTCPELLGSDSV
jgi:Alcohol dehydrogenase GroES-like domain